MKKGLRSRLTLHLSLIATSVLIFSSIVYALEIHYHFSMFQDESAAGHNMGSLSTHLERAVLESIFFTAAGSIILVFIISHFAAGRLSSPLIQMKAAAEKMSRGNWGTRVAAEGQDELAALGQSLNTLAQELENQEQARKDMTADIAHELRTPLSTLKSFMEAFEDRVWEPEPPRLRACTREIDRLIHLIQDLEQLNSLESPQLRMSFESRSLRQLIKECIDSAADSFKNKNIELSASLTGELIFFFDQERLKQILINLLSNSLKYTSPGGKVIISAIEEKDTVLLKVTDNGTGIAPQSLEKVFDRFFREDASRSRETGGSGIGLAIVKKLIAAHHGEIWIDSQRGEGTAVNLRLPKQINQPSIFITSS
ncbi:sensor histidine kinase [Peribacillus sp. SCS-26]|uniref:sensor histidine kinase n=1 Tax=Paraperibacillus marinus TaxID=3115295 RepID=UPI003905F73F